MNNFPPSTPQHIVRLYSPVMLVACLVISSDQLTKYLIRSVLQPGEHKSYLGGAVQFILVENNGGFLGILNQFSEETRLLLLNFGVGLLLFAVFFFLIFRVRNLWIATYLAAIIGGGLSNLLDRLFNNGGVTDFMLLQLFGVHTGIFNLADVYILIGSCLLGYTLATRADNRLPAP